MKIRLASFAVTLLTVAGLLGIVAPARGLCANDVYEENDSAPTATDLPARTFDAAICSGDLDLYEVTLVAGEEATVRVYPSPGLDVGIALLNADEVGVASADIGFAGQSEFMSYAVPATGEYHMVVYGFESDEGTYVLRVENAVLPVPITSVLDPVTEDFDSLVTTGNDGLTPFGWTFAENGEGANTGLNADDGSASAGNTYSYGTGAEAERALGSLRGSTFSSQLRAAYRNLTGDEVGSVTISYTGEQWRTGATGRGADQLDFTYAEGSGAFLEHSALDFGTQSAAAVGPTEGNAAMNRASRSAVIDGLSLPHGEVLHLRWSDVDAFGADDGLAIDDFTITAAGIADADGDGVRDEDDACSGTPSGTEVEGTGCAQSQIDGDEDGVTNDQDLCPSTPANTIVDESGCTLVDEDPPDTFVDSGPGAKTKKGKAAFTYSSNEAPVTFECRLYKTKASAVPDFEGCAAAGIAYTKLKNGRYVFEVRAIDQFDNVDDTPALVPFKVKRV